jgi:hypothetical protein
MLESAALIAEHLEITKRAFRALVTRYRDTENMPITYVNKGPGRVEISAKPDEILDWYKEHNRLAIDRQAKGRK